MPAEVQAVVHGRCGSGGLGESWCAAPGGRFCDGYNFGGGFSTLDDQRTSDWQVGPRKDFIVRKRRRAIAGPAAVSVALAKAGGSQVHGWASVVAATSPCADLVVRQRRTR